MSRVIVAGAKEDISAEYELGNVLGRGAFSVVKLCTRKTDKQEFAVKIITKSSLRGTALQCIKTEVDVLKRVAGHPKICKLEDVFEDSTSLYLVMELIKGGELFDQIEKAVYYSEQSGSQILSAILAAIEHCHKQHVLHRDLKPENLMVADLDFKNLTDIKLADFGISAIIEGDGLAHGSIGTPMYAAPEVISDRDYGLAADMWSLGVIAYIILGGYPPFSDPDPVRLNRMILSGRFEFHSPEWDEVSSVSRDFISKLLVVDPAKRMTVEQALEHPFIKDAYTLLSSQINQGLADRFTKFNAGRKFRAAVGSILAGNRLLSLTKVGKPKKCTSFTFSTSDWKLLEGLSKKLSETHAELKLTIEFEEKLRATFIFSDAHLPPINIVRKNITAAAKEILGETSEEFMQGINFILIEDKDTPKPSDKPTDSESK